MPVIGLVMPHAGHVLPNEAAQLYPDITFIAHGTGVGSLTPAGYDQAWGKIIPAADNLAAQGVDAIMLMGTSLTFYRGPQYNEDLIGEVKRRTGLPVSSMSSAIVEGVRAFGAKSLAVSTAYTDVVNRKLVELLEFHGFDVRALECFGITEFGDGAIRKTEDEIIDLTSHAVQKAPEADAVLISCGGLRTLNVAVPLEARFDKPVVSSTPAALWTGVRLTGADGRAAGFGRLLDNDAPALH